MPPRKRKRQTPVESRVPMAVTVSTTSGVVSISQSYDSPVSTSQAYYSACESPVYASQTPGFSPRAPGFQGQPPCFSPRGFSPSTSGYPLVDHGFSPHASQFPSPHPFKLCFISGNVSICQGCLRKYPKPPDPPHDIVIQHEEWRNFVAGGIPQTRFGNAYYHASVQCVQLRWSMFMAYQLQIPESVFTQLNERHRQLLTM